MAQLMDTLFLVFMIKIINKQNNLPHKKKQKKKLKRVKENPDLNSKYILEELTLAMALILRESV